MSQNKMSTLITYSPLDSNAKWKSNASNSANAPYAAPVRVDPTIILGGRKLLCGRTFVETLLVMTMFSSETPFVKNLR